MEKLTAWECVQISSGWYKLGKKSPEMSRHGETLLDVINSENVETKNLYIDSLNSLYKIYKHDSVFPNGVPDTFLKAIQKAIMLISSSSLTVNPTKIKVSNLNQQTSVITIDSEWTIELIGILKTFISDSKDNPYRSVKGAKAILKEVQKQVQN